MLNNLLYYPHDKLPEYNDSFIVCEIIELKIVQPSEEMRINMSRENF
jgi:hypothetical protein